MNECNAFVVATLATLGLGACSAPHGSNSVSIQHVSRIDSSHIAVHARGRATDAVVSSEGELAIGGRVIPLSPTQRDGVRAYYAAADALRNDAIATGKAGIATAASAIGSVARGLASGNPDQIGEQVDAQAAKVEASAAKVCADVARLKARQDALAASVAEFLPYATISDGEAARCDR